MTSTAPANPAFDPEFCPLLRNLSPEEQRRRMEEDPIIRSCIGGLAKNDGPGAVCRAAYEKQRGKCASKKAAETA